MATFDSLTAEQVKRRKVLAGIMQRAHFNARWKKTNGDKTAYRVLLGEMMKLEWSRLKQAAAAKKSWELRQQIRDDANFNGLPIASCIADRAVRLRSTRMSAAIGE